MIYTLSIIFIVSIYLVTLRKEEITKSLNKMYNCFDIAKYFVKLAKEEGQGIDPMKLLKLTYISQGYYLGFKDKPLFSNKIQAWKYGPVIPALYYVIKPFGYNNVDPIVLDLHTRNEIKEEDKNSLKSLWSAYKNASGIRLSELTHEENTPWYKTYIEGVSNINIEEGVIKDYYKTKIASTNV